MADFEHFVVTELERNGIEYQIRRNFVEVSCPFHEHSGRKKKLGISRTGGGLNCWVCGKKGHYNEYAELLGLSKVKDNDARLQDFRVLQRDFDKAIAGADEPAVPDWVIPWNRPRWRKLPRDFIISIPSYEWHDVESDANRILWPVYVNDRFRGCTTARIRPNDKSVWPKTRNLGGLNAQKILFPFDYPLIRESEVIVLVEGVFDALRLIYHGIPAVSILGAGAWDPHKLTLLALRSVQRLVLAFDGDEAGEDLGDVVREAAEGMFDVDTFVFPDPDDEELERGIESIDPGNCSRPELERLSELVAA